MGNMQMSTTIERAGHSNIPPDIARNYILIMLVNDRPGAVDRVVGLMRRRRANMQTLVMSQSITPAVVRLSIIVNDSEVGIHHLVEQLRKVVDIQEVISLTAEQAITRELALIKVSKDDANFNDIIACGLLFGAHTVDVTPETVTLEIAGSVENVEKLIERLQAYGIREIARSGHVSIARGNEQN
jgi:acetolactate synthase-1/3 small subunit